MAPHQAVADVEAALDDIEYLDGYVDFSQFIASDQTLSIYRKFSILGARNSLYLGAELQLSVSSKRWMKTTKESSEVRGTPRKREEKSALLDLGTT
jgi:hypothetical protein